MHTLILLSWRDVALNEQDRGNERGPPEICRSSRETGQGKSLPYGLREAPAPASLRVRAPLFLASLASSTGLAP